MNPIEKILSEFSVMVLDGAMATELEKYDCNLNDRLWSAKVLIENPELIKNVHKAYFAAGADCAITASYQATIEGFTERDMSEQEAVELIKKSVQIAREAREEYLQNNVEQLNRPEPLIAASVGPYGAYLADGSEYCGDYALTESELMDFHRTRMKVLIEAGADILACETIPCLKEAKAIVHLLKEFPDVYAWISFSAKDGEHISNGETMAECARWLNNQEQVAAVGINCTAPNYIPQLIKEIKHHTEKPIIVYPNYGDVYNPVNKTWERPVAEADNSFNPQRWYTEGATIIGGCCRTTPKDIENIKNLFRN